MKPLRPHSHGADNPISVGDLVMVVRSTPCCKNDTRIGEIFVFQPHRKDIAWCGFCGAQVIDDYTRVNADRLIQVNRLKRIPPMGELEGERTDETIKETV